MNWKSRRGQLQGDKITNVGFRVFRERSYLGSDHNDLLPKYPTSFPILSLTSHIYRNTAWMASYTFVPMYDCQRSAISTRNLVLQHKK